MTEANGCAVGATAPVFDVDLSVVREYPNGDKLPALWVTRPVVDEEGNSVERVRMGLYPAPDYEDADGGDALWYGADYYNEGMSYTDPADHEKRIDCFRAAELLYRHAAGWGNPIACLNLGYVYSYDRCEGRYWTDAADAASGAATWSAQERKRRAFDCLRIAAEADIAEACYKLGDMYKHGTGCNADAGEAFRWYAQASKVAGREAPAILGSIALRLAGCYEEGFGCTHDFDRALSWYKQAVLGLEAAVEAGDTWYAKALAGARAGEKRCKQEV